MSSLIDSIVGSDEEFDLQHQIFHRITGISGLAILFSLLVSLFLDIPEVSLMLIATCIIITFCLWLSRVLKMFRTALTIFIIAAHALIIANFFLNNGIGGSSLIVSLLVISILFSISTTKQKLIWTIVQIIVVASLIGHQYYYGNVYILDYPSRESRFVDQLLTYITALTFLFVLFQVIIRKNEKQKEELVHKEQQIRDQRDNLKQSNEELHKLMSVIAHDVRNPLASIESFLQPEMQSMISQEERDYINNELLNLVKNTSHMLDETLHWSRSKYESESQLVRREAAIGTWLQGTLDHMRGMAKTKQIFLTEDYDGSIRLNCDPNLLTVVIRNILQNAIKFSNSGDSITFKADKSDHGVVFTIGDTGIGMTEGKIKTILDQNRHESTVGTKNESGTGFGLMISKEYIKLHGGELDISSELGRGTTFKVTIPNLDSDL